MSAPQRKSYSMPHDQLPGQNHSATLNLRREEANRP